MGVLMGLVRGGGLETFKPTGDGVKLCLCVKCHEASKGAWRTGAIWKPHAGLSC